MKRVLLIITVLVVMVIGCGCDDDDFAPYENNSCELSEQLSGNVYVISQIQPQVDKIAARYSDKAELYYAQYTFEGADSGELLLSYKNQYTKGDTGYTELVDVYIDLQTKTATKAVYENGHAKRVGGHGSAHIKNKEIDALQIYQKHLPEAQKQGQLNNMTITFENNDVLINGWDSDNQNLYHKKEPQ